MASRQPYQVPLGSAGVTSSTAHYRAPPSAAPATNGTNHNVFTSPTESEFSESYRESTGEAVQDWDEVRVGEWLKSIDCAHYVDLFRRNNINGENLMDIDLMMLKEIGVKKLGDRKRASKRVMNRQSLATLDGNSQLTPPSSASPRHMHSARATTSTRAEKRMSRQITGQDATAYGTHLTVKASSRPGSPLIDQENRIRVQRATPIDNTRKEQSASYFTQPPSSSTSSRFGNRSTPVETPQTARFAGHVKQSPSLEHLSTANVAGALPSDKALIRVIFETGRWSVLNIEGFRSAEDIVRATLKKGNLNENHCRSYCFYVLDGTDPNPTYCRRISDGELVRLCQDKVRSERGRLILRKIHAGEPEGDQLRAAARIAEQQQPSPPAIEVQQPPKSRSQLKIEKVFGEPLAAVSYPMSPASQAERREYFDSEHAISRNVSTSTTASARARKLKDFYGARPPTELITQDLQSYFPEVKKEEMDRTVRMSVRRSQRMSKAMSRLSIASNFSMGSVAHDAPPLPSIADRYLNQAAGGRPGLRPLSVVRLGLPNAGYRDSVASSMLSPLDEESPLEPNRKSYVSFGADSNSDGVSSTTTSTNIAVTDPDGHSSNAGMNSYFDDTASTSPPGTEHNSLNSRLSHYIAEDGEEEDEELMQHLEKDSWDDLKYMKGAMIGQGSFGTVYLALHAVTAELMAVKQVEMPSASNTALDAKKTNMIEALKHEISLLRELKHPNIVQYLGSNSDAQHLNIFLEYVAGGSVASMLVNYGPLNESLCANFVRQILQGLAYLHSKDIIHRDIKGANILVDNKGTVKISDFGISKRVEASSLLSSADAPPGTKPRPHNPRVSLQGSVFWMAPEVVRQTAYTKKADIWSLGCLIVEMMTGSHPHPNCTQLQAIFRIGGTGQGGSQAKPDLPSGISADAKEFLESVFEIEFERRPTAEELLQSAFCRLRG
ncbi:hypothetical protein B0A48_06186 [Cryoendolithus antarcticus]|uniref:mitogen-activated protein kinase kinase kinase n=1 Tax=Cryoendolithus antarcticus TaxID=1507870 RepID=A0A1V8TA97_9PEZI|nr:hypothetical protein B0A48_06186 [Cryoendolithus antarcticus]